MSQKLKEEELKNTLILKMKENKLKSKNEIWKTLTDGLTKIVSTIVSAVVPTAGVEHILMKVIYRFPISFLNVNDSSVFDKII